MYMYTLVPLLSSTRRAHFASRCEDLDEIRSDLQVVDSEHRVTHRESLLCIHEARVVED